MSVWVKGRLRLAAGLRLLQRDQSAAGLSLALCVAGFVFLVGSLNELGNVERWLVLRYLLIGSWLLLFSAACTSFGYCVLVRGLRLRELRSAEAAVLGMALGTVAFVLAMYVAGALGAFRPWFAVALPVSLLAIGARDGICLIRRVHRESNEAPVSIASWVAGAFGILSVGGMYFRILTPDALGYDASWFHVKIAQDYARWGRIGPFTADYSHALPHLASILYTWGYLIPGLHVVERWLFALHMEFCLLLWTLAGVGVAVGRQLGGVAPRGSWAAYFLLPGTFFYGVMATSEHVIGFFAIPIALATVHIWREPRAGTGALFGILLGAALLTKYQAVFLGVPACALALVGCLLAFRKRTIFEDGGRQWRSLLYVGLAFAFSGAVVVAPHFIKNFVYYGNPFYPFLMDGFPSRPTAPESALLFKHGMQPSGFVPLGNLLDKAVHSLKLWVTVSALPRDSYPEGAASLFVLCLPALVWLREHRALPIFALLGSGALLLWGIILAHTRYIEAFTAVLASVVGALLVRIWRLGWIARSGMIPLVAITCLWVAGGPFSGSALGLAQSSLALVQSAIAGQGKATFASYRSDYVALGRSLPNDAKIVLHTSGVSLGIDRDVLMDSMGFQALIDYRPMRTPRDVFERFRALAVTHTLHEPNGYPSPTLQEDVLFHALVKHYGIHHGNYGGLFVSALPERAPPREQPYRVLCSGLAEYADGLYRIEQLGVWFHLPPEARAQPDPEIITVVGNESELLKHADALVCGEQCALATRAEEAAFQRVRDRAGKSALFLRPVATESGDHGVGTDPE